MNFKFSILFRFHLLQLSIYLLKYQQVSVILQAVCQLLKIIQINKICFLALLRSELALGIKYDVNHFINFWKHSDDKRKILFKHFRSRTSQQLNFLIWNCKPVE